MAVGRKLTSAPKVSIKERLVAVLHIKMQLLKPSWNSAGLYTESMKIKVIYNNEDKGYIQQKILKINST